MKIIYNKYLPVKGFSAMNLFGIIFARKEFIPLSNKTINHEQIHTTQMRELLYIFFYIWYGLEWLIRWVGYGLKAKKAYRNIWFEKEAYKYENDLEYLRKRKLFAWLIHKRQSQQKK